MKANPINSKTMYNKSFIITCNIHLRFPSSAKLSIVNWYATEPRKRPMTPIWHPRRQFNFLWCKDVSKKVERAILLKQAYSNLDVYFTKRFVIVRKNIASV